MKIVKRVSPIKSIERIEEPSPSSPKMTRITWNRHKPYTLTPQQELYRFGYRNRPHRPWLVAAALAAFLAGTLLDNTEKLLMDVLVLVVRTSG